MYSCFFPDFFHLADWCNICIQNNFALKSLSVSSGMSRSLESVLSGHRPRAHTVGVVRVDQHGRLMPPIMAAHSMVMQQDPRRFSEASIIPPPRPPPPNLKRLNMRSQRRPPVNLPPGGPWPPQVTVPAPAQPQPQLQPQHPPQPGVGGSNLAKMVNLARSTPQLDDYTESRERDREKERNRDREKSPHVHHTKDSLITQVRDEFCYCFGLVFFMHETLPRG